MKVGTLAIAVSMMVALAPQVHGQDANLGQSLYTTNCQTCHGSYGIGDGEFAQFLTIRPSNLAILSSENDGVFPFLEVFQVVDGRTGVRGHGAPPDMPIWGSGFDMPIWGAVFERELGPLGDEYGTELLVRARIVALVDYIETLQVD